ncbi:hypothetical protein [Schlesneria paludicola]|uniref:hypothetical protein n=1 Tax=Schlesneria paludicola TaxID=360056 RepID=UPI0004922E48|nr:hypothetical protein [Schlesneria paludicola]
MISLNSTSLSAVASNALSSKLLAVQTGTARTPVVSTPAAAATQYFQAKTIAAAAEKQQANDLAEATRQVNRFLQDGTPMRALQIADGRGASVNAAPLPAPSSSQTSSSNTESGVSTTTSATTASPLGIGKNNPNSTLTNQQYGEQLVAKSVDQAVAFVAKVIANNRNTFAAMYQNAMSGGMQLASITDPNGSLLSLAKYQQSASSTITANQSATKLLNLFT